MQPNLVALIKFYLFNILYNFDLILVKSAMYFVPISRTKQYHITYSQITAVRGLFMSIALEGLAGMFPHLTSADWQGHEMIYFPTETELVRDYYPKWHHSAVLCHICCQ